MILVTGDCHGDFRKFSTKRFPIQKQMTKNDKVVMPYKTKSIPENDL